MSPGAAKITASISIACAVVAMTMPTVSRMLYDAANPGNDNFGSALAMIPVLVIIGVVLALVARRGGAGQLSRIALWLNLGLLVAMILFLGFAMFSYQGR